MKKPSDYLKNFNNKGNPSLSTIDKNRIVLYLYTKKVTDQWEFVMNYQPFLLLPEDYRKYWNRLRNWNGHRWRWFKADSASQEHAERLKYRDNYIKLDGNKKKWYFKTKKVHFGWYWWHKLSLERYSQETKICLQQKYWWLKFESLGLDITLDLDCVSEESKNFIWLRISLKHSLYQFV